jgi:pilus assembly protein Flp/PilA
MPQTQACETSTRRKNVQAVISLVPATVDLGIRRPWGCNVKTSLEFESNIFQLDSRDDKVRHLEWHPGSMTGREPAWQGNQGTSSYGTGHIMTDLAKRFAKDESAATAIEYGLIAAGISVAIITVVNTLGSQLQTTFGFVSSQLATAGK